jgi:phospholipid N-methyltransferase
MSSPASDRVRFLRAFVQSPRYVGSVLPSSARLAEAMVRPVDFATAELIVELGAGTGPFTKLISRRLAPDTRALVFERDQAMSNTLQARYPNLEFHSDALELAELVRSANGSGVDAVVCSLPFATFPRAMRARITHDIHRVLRPGGKLIAVQYSTQMRRSFQALFDSVSLSLVPLNVPPAIVYTCTKGTSAPQPRPSSHPATHQLAGLVDHDYS